MVQTDLIGDEAISVTLLGERTFGWGTDAQRPTSNFHLNGFYIATDTAKIYQNSGVGATEMVPVWVELISSVNSGLILALGD